MLCSTKKRKAVVHPKVSSPLTAEIGPRLLHGFGSTTSPYPSVVCETPAKYHPSPNEVRRPDFQKKVAHIPASAMCAAERQEVAMMITRISTGLSTWVLFAHSRNNVKKSARPKRMPACNAETSVARSSASA